LVHSKKNRRRKEKKGKEKKIGASKLGIGFICSIEKGEKYVHDLISCSLSSRYFC